MTETTTVTTLTRQTVNLNLASLKTVTWLETNPVVQDVTSFTSRQCDKARQYTVIQWIFTLVQFQLTWLWTLLHTLPWPSWVIEMVHKADDFVEAVLESVYCRLEWWWDYLTIRLMRLFESVVTFLDKFITVVDTTIGWLLQRYEWVYDLAQRAVAIVKGVYEWYVALWTTVWGYIWSLVHNMQQMWTASQEEMKSAKDQHPKREMLASAVRQPPQPLLLMTPEELQPHELHQEQQQQHDYNQHHHPEPEQQQQQIIPSHYRRQRCTSGSDKRLSFSADVDDGSDLLSNGGDSRRESRASRRNSRSDSDGSDVAGIQETVTHFVGEQTGRPYSRVHTEATVVGRQRAAMYHRVSTRLQIMRKNSIRFSRGMDVRVSKLIATAQSKFTPRSLMSLYLSLIKFILLAPFKVVMWLVGGKRLSRRSRSMRSESARRREAAAAAAASAKLPAAPLGPAALLQSAEPAAMLQPAYSQQQQSDSSSNHSVPCKEGLREESPDSAKRDSGVSEDNHDSSEEWPQVPFPTTPAPAAVTTPTSITPSASIVYQARGEKYLSLSSTSTINEEPDEDDVPPTPPSTPKMRTRRSYAMGSSPPRSLHATSEPDLRVPTELTADEASSRELLQRRSVGAMLDFSPPQTRKPKKRVTIQ